MNKFTRTLFILVLFLSLFSEAALSRVYDYTTGNKITLLEDARKAVDLKMEWARSAKHHIHITSFYWDDKGYPIKLMQELAKAHARGVEVRIMTTLLPDLTMDFLGKARRTLYKNHRKSKATLAFLKLAPGNRQGLTHNLHEKIFLVDGKQAIIGGRNISDNDFRAKDLEIILEGEVVNQVQKHFELMFQFMIQQNVTIYCANVEDPTCPEQYEKLAYNTKESDRYYPVQPQFSEGVKARILTNEILLYQRQNYLRGEKRFLAPDDIMDTIVKTEYNHLRAYNYFIIPTNKYKAFLEKSLALGKSINVITNSQKTAAHISDAGYLYGLPEMRNLIHRGMQVYEWLGAEPEAGEDHQHYLHEKVMLFDDDHAIVGSHNFGSGSTSVSSEIAVEFFSKPIVERLIDVFEEEINNSRKTQKATLKNVDQLLVKHKNMIKFLHMVFVRNLIRELY